MQVQHRHYIYSGVYEFSSEIWHIMYLISCVPYVVALGLMGTM